MRGASAVARIEVIANRAIAELRELQATLGQEKSEREATEVLQERRQRLKSEVESCRSALRKDPENYARRKVCPILNRAFEIINLQISPILKDINDDLQFAAR